MLMLAAVPVHHARGGRPLQGSRPSTAGRVPSRRWASRPFTTKATRRRRLLGLLGLTQTTWALQAACQSDNSVTSHHTLPTENLLGGHWWLDGTPTKKECGEATHQCPLGAVACCCSRFLVDARASDDVIVFEGRSS